MIRNIKGIAGAAYSTGTKSSAATSTHRSTTAALVYFAPLYGDQKPAIHKYRFSSALWCRLKACTYISTLLTKPPMSRGNYFTRTCYSNVITTRRMQTLLPVERGLWPGGLCPGGGGYVRTPPNMPIANYCHSLIFLFDLYYLRSEPRRNVVQQ